ncbi:MAG TPA: YbaN family protein [Microvirga sp.]|nr:YbaN family protein [Microvirga sp.]
MAGRPPDREPDPGRKRPRAAFWRPLFFGLGWLFLAVGVAGVFLPLVPGTLFLILAAACFTRSSPRFESWVLDHPRFGPPVRRWRERGAIPRHVKGYACLSLAASWALIVAAGAPAEAALGALALFAAVAAFIATRPES